MSHKRSTIVHEFYCTQCGEHGISVHRKYGQFREVGHLKKLYCLTCGKEWNARSFTEKSDVLNNIRSKTWWREKDSLGIIKVEVTIV